MTEDEAYKVHIQYTFNAFCKVVIRHAAIDEKFVQLAEPEQLEEYLFTACGQTAVLYHAELAAALALLSEQAQEEIFRYYFLRQPQRLLRRLQRIYSADRLPGRCSKLQTPSMRWKQGITITGVTFRQVMKSAHWQKT